MNMAMIPTRQSSLLLARAAGTNRVKPASDAFHLHVQVQPASLIS